MPRQTGRLTVGRNIRLDSTNSSEFAGGDRRGESPAGARRGEFSGGDRHGRFSCEEELQTI
jgi:hypothetical protein